jgi:DNA-binding response OmpR family regulator
MEIKMQETKILVVDDEEKICENVERILAKNHYEVSRATTAEEALRRIVEESFSLLISDIVMPDMDGLELLKLVKNQSPLTKVIMITAYASTDTAMKAIRLGAVDYLPKPFTPDELRTTTEKALTGKLREAPGTQKEKDSAGIIDVDIPFDRDEVAKYTGEAYAGMLGPSDMPVVEATGPEGLENFCMVGEMICDIYRKLGSTCKAGTKTSTCPQKKAKKKLAAKKMEGFDAKNLIGIDQPFDYKEVISVTGPEYVQNLHHDGMSFVPYEELKKHMAGLAEVRAEAHNILVIDDEVAVNNNIRRILTDKGYQVEQAVTKEEALQRIKSHDYQLVLLDLRMPGVKGLELLEAIRERRPEAMVVIVTGYASIETAVETARLGAVDYLPKPFTPDEIRITTENALRLAT